MNTIDLTKQNYFEYRGYTVVMHAADSWETYCTSWDGKAWILRSTGDVFETGTEAKQLIDSKLKLIERDTKS